jgi:F0F1-type ATP synthase assembly protein I
MKKKNNSEVLKALVMITQIGLSLMTVMAISLYIGYWLDKLCGTRFIVIIMMFIGMGASVRNIIMLAKSFNEKDLKTEGKKNGESKK